MMKTLKLLTNILATLILLGGGWYLFLSDRYDPGQKLLIAGYLVVVCTISIGALWLIAKRERRKAQTAADGEDSPET